MRHAFRIAAVVVCVLLSAGVQRSAFASSQTQTYELHLEVPQVSQAANGDVVSITGDGVFFNYWGSPMLRRMSTKRGSERSGSNAGFGFRKITSRSLTACSSASSARLLFPSPR